MDLTLPAIVQMLRETLTDPRGLARRLLAMGLPLRARWMALALVAALSTLLAYLTLAVLSGGTAQGLLPGPVGFALFQCGVLVATAGLVHRIGRWRGGRGGFADALLLVVWLQVVLLGLQLAQLVFSLVLPPLADIIGVVGMGLFFWLLTCFVAELHGFRALLPVFLGIVGTFIAIAVVLATVLGSMLGVPQGV